MKTIIALVLGVAMLFAGGARAGHSPLDETFNGDGGALVPLDSISTTMVQPDGKILVAGSAGYHFGVVRLESDGSLDTGFDGDGLATTESIPGFSGVARGIVVQTDGKIVLAGDGGDFKVVRFTANGAVDATFGVGGAATLDVAAGDETRCVVIQPDGKVVVSGQGGDDLVVFRLDGTGTLDPTFDGDGIATIDFGLLPEAGCLALQPDGKIVVAAQVGVDGGVLRYDTNGSLDPTFDGDGIAVVTLPSPYLVKEVAVQSSGRVILVGGSGSSDAAAMVLAGLDAGGTLDPTFDGDGLVFTRIWDAPFQAVKLLVQPDDRIVVVGGVMPRPLGLVRYEADGRRDPTLDGDGALTSDLIHDLGAVGVGHARGGALDAAGRIVVAVGAFGTFPLFEAYVVRYDVPPVCDPTPRLDCETAWQAADLRSIESMPGRERLVARLTSGPPLQQSAFGNPVALSGTQYRLCLYDDADRLVASVDVDRGGEFCEGTACWKEVAEVGYAYLDHERSADGAQRMLLRGGSTRSLITLLGRNRRSAFQWDLPTGIPEGLAGTTSVTMQFVPSDTAGCFSKQLSQILVATATKFRAK